MNENHGIVAAHGRQETRFFVYEICKTIIERLANFAGFGCLDCAANDGALEQHRAACETAHLSSEYTNVVGDELREF